MQKVFEAVMKISEVHRNFNRLKPPLDAHVKFLEHAMNNVSFLGSAKKNPQFASWDAEKFLKRAIRIHEHDLRNGAAEVVSEKNGVVWVGIFEEQNLDAPDEFQQEWREAAKTEMEKVARSFKHGYYRVKYFNVGGKHILEYSPLSLEEPFERLRSLWNRLKPNK